MMEATNKSLTPSYSVTGSAAYTRLSPLLPEDWRDVTNDPKAVPDFVWENAPRKVTKPYRDQLKAYSHLPNGTAILDSKWVLARLFEERSNSRSATSTANDKHQNNNIYDPYLAYLESHCFRGNQGYAEFCEQAFSKTEQPEAPAEDTNDEAVIVFPDLLVNNGQCPEKVHQEPSSLWVVKDAFSNGAGGIWVVDKHSQMNLVNSNGNNNNQGPLYEDHRYVAQRYAWPPVLYGGRKCHVRVYGLVTADGRAFVHKRAFLHVANDAFAYSDNHDDSSHFQDSVHITNCCANSHDDDKFAGEILADLEASDFVVDSETGQTIVPLQPFFPSIKASLAALAQRTWPFVSGGQGNNGFEYLGMDFILSYRKSSSSDGQQHQPVAYMLEVNAPPSQDTATGLKHAEDLHDNVIRDILTLWVIPKVMGEATPENPGGWRCAYTAPIDDNDGDGVVILPSKAAIINKIRWGMMERKTSKLKEAKNNVPEPRIDIEVNTQQERYVTSEEISSTCKMKKLSSSSTDLVSRFVRKECFPYFFQHQQQLTDSVVCGDKSEEHSSSRAKEQAVTARHEIFWESAGGAQVPMHVIDRMSASLKHRHRSRIGTAEKNKARDIISKLLGAEAEEYCVFLGANATSLLSNLAHQYVQSGLLQQDDEIVLSTENHVANVNPWLLAAHQCGARIRWWTPTRKSKDAQNDSWSTKLPDLLSSKTRIVAMPHASNVLGQIRDLTSLRKLIDEQTGGYAHFIVDGVAAAPHWYPAVSEHQVDWYVVSCHKLFGPTLGGLCGRRQTAVKLLCDSAKVDNDKNESIYKLLEVGTINCEGCAGVHGLGEYFGELASVSLSSDETSKPEVNNQTPFQSPQEEGFLSRIKPRKVFSLSSGGVLEAYQRIREVEQPLVESLLSALRQSTKVRIIELEDTSLKCLAKLPVISFKHETIESSRIVEVCANNGIVCRNGCFLSNSLLPKDLGFGGTEGVVRFSLVHYNTLDEIKVVMRVLASIPGWY